MKNTFVKVLSFVMALTMIVGAFSMVVSAADCAHENTEVVVKEATCANAGYTLYTCTDCGTQWIADRVAKSEEHTGVTEIPAADATCTEPAKTAGSYCAHCQVNPKGEPTDYIVEPKAVEGSEALGHAFKGIAPDCFYVNKHVCARCGKSPEKLIEEFEGDTTKINAFKEKYSAFLAEARPTVPGPNDPEDVELYGHDFEFVLESAPGKCTDGLVIATCEDCGTVEEAVLYGTHNFTKEYPACHPKEGHYCKDCGKDSSDVEDRDEDEIEHNFGFEPSYDSAYIKAINVALQNLGYTSENIYVAPTCTTAGHGVLQCLGCEQYVEIPLNALGHKMTTTTSVETNDTDACVPGKTVYFYCEREVKTGGVVIGGKRVCGERDVVSTTADKGHMIVTTVIAPTCSKEGKTVDKCVYPRCTYEKEYNYTAKADHVLGEYKYSYDVSYGIDHSKDLTRWQECECEHENCDCTYTTSKQTIIAKTSTGDHAWSDVISLSAANCTYAAAYVKVCTVDGCDTAKYVDENGADILGADNAIILVGDDIEDNDDIVFDGDVNTNVHATSALTQLAAQAATCTKTGWVKYWCDTCGKEVVVETPMIDHVPSTTCDINGDGDYKDAGEDVRAKAATCTKTGLTEGSICGKCGKVFVAQTIEPKNPDNHVKSDGSTPGVGTKTSEVPANCQNFGSYVTYWDCCNKYVTTVITEGALVPTTHINKTTVKYKAATCTEDGNHKYTICADCGVITLAADCDCGLNHADVDTHIIPSTRGHQGTLQLVANSAKAETCTDNGYKAAYKYTCCDVTVGGEYIAPHGSKYAIKEVEDTCYSYGIVFTEAGKDADYVCYYCDYETLWNVVDEVEHNFVQISTATNDCTAPTYKVYECTICGALSADSYAKAQKTEHQYNVNWREFVDAVDGGKIDENTKTLKMYDKNGALIDVNKDVKVGGVKLNKYSTGAICNTYTFQYRYCVACGKIDVKADSVKAPVDHMNGTTKISYACTDIENFIGLACDFCQVDITVDAIEDDSIVEHNISILEQEATCTEDGYYVMLCLDCNKEYYNVDVEAPGHDVVYVIETVESTTSTPGYRKLYCSICGEVTEELEPIEGLGLTVTYSNAAVQNGTVTVQIAVSATELEFNSLTFVLPVSEALTLVGSELVYGFDKADAVNMAAKQNYIDGEDGVISLVAVKVYVGNVVSGVTKNVVLDGEEVAFINLTFKVSATADVEEALIEEKSIGVAEYAVVDEDGELDNDADINLTSTMEALELTWIADVSGDGNFDNGDHIAMLNYIYSGEYNVVADLNGDGVVDIDDHYALINFLVSDTDWVDYLEMMGITAATLVAEYNNRYDYNGDGLVNDSDAALLEAYVEDILADIVSLANVDLAELVKSAANALFMMGNN